MYINDDIKNEIYFAYKNQAHNCLSVYIFLIFLDFFLFFYNDAKTSLIKNFSYYSSFLMQEFGF